ncbi:MAG TPA: hypothetical protein PKM43_16005 [Verrucomicrobiota bacterium]|nr:hypothetical protein [Verrucomicrobiota bacterium]
MPTTYTKADAGLLLIPLEDQAVPLAVLTDDTPFGAAAATAFERACPTGLRNILLRGQLPDLPDLIRQRFDYRFRARILPLVLCEHEPTWVAWYFSYSSEKLDLITHAMQETPPELAGELRWFVFVHFNSRSDWAAAKSQLMTLPTEAGFALCDQGLSVRPPASLGAGAAVFSLAAWSRFRDAGDGNIAAAWLLPLHQAPWFTLGMAMDGPDLEYHREAGAVLVAGHVLEGWQRPGPHPERPSLPAPSLLVPQLLPQEYRCEPVSFQEEAEHRLLFDCVSLRLGCAVRVPGDPSAANTSRDILTDWLAEVQHFHQWLRLTAEPPTLVAISENADTVLPSLLSSMRVQVRLGELPEGALDSLGKRLADCAAYANGLLSARSQPAHARESLACAQAKAERQIAAIPNWQAGLLRFGLIAVGLVWLCLGSLVWPGQARPSLADGTGWIGFYSAIALALLLAAVLGQGWYWRIRAWRAVERVRQLVVADHLSRIGEAVTAQLHSLGQAVRDQLQPLQKALATLQKELLEQPPPALRRANDNPRFTDKALKTFLGPRTALLAEAAHLATRTELHGHDDWPHFTATRWLSLLRSHALALVTPMLEQLSYDDWVRAQGLVTKDKVLLLRNLVLEARRPAWGLRPNASAVLCLARAAEWRPCAGQHDELEFLHLEWREMLTVSPISLPEGA